MFCTKCGTALQASDHFCPKCGQAISASSAPIELSPPGQSGSGQSLWNPMAAAYWSLLLTPTFGAFLHALNWRSLGEGEKEKSAFAWFYVSLAVLAICVFMGAFIENQTTAFNLANGLGFLYFFIWYFSTARAQAKFVEEKLGAEYPRRGWGKPLLIAVAVFIGICLVTSIIGAPQ